MKISFQAVGITLAFYGAITFIALQAVVPVLDRATATQCQQHDWPVNAHQVHMDWCAANNYPTN
jgi:hypothetical protein